MADRFRVESEIGRGALGNVYSARSVVENEPLALKWTIVQASPEVLDQVGAIVKRHSTVAHPGLVRIHAFGVHRGRLWYASDYAEGESAQHELHRTHQAISSERAISTVRQVGEALVVAHRGGLFHRELKASNIIFLRDAPRAAVLDAGFLGALIDASGAMGLDAREIARQLITPGMDAPEQLEAGPADGRTDVYGLGAVLFHLLMGRKPFPPGQESRAIALGVVPPKMSNVSRAVEKIVQRAMEPDPDDRFQSMHEFVRAIEKL